jgi:nitroreductase
MTRSGLVTDTMFVDAVRTAVAAPSLHNAQPWRFRHDRATDSVQVRADQALRLADPTGWGTRIALGAVTYNLTLAFAVAGWPMQVAWLPSNTDPDLYAVLTPGPARAATSEEDRLYRAIPRRHSHRATFYPEPVPALARTEILRAARAELAWIELVTGAAAVAAVAQIVQTAQQVLRREPGQVAALRAAWTDEVDPLVAVLGTPGDLAVDHLRAGYALQRVLLTVTDLGLRAAMFSQPIEVPSAREQLRLALGRFGTPQMVLRIGHGDAAPRVPRRAAEEVIDT